MKVAAREKFWSKNSTKLKKCKIETTGTFI
jgi:hypothetical protein